MNSPVAGLLEVHAVIIADGGTPSPSVEHGPPPFDRGVPAPWARRDPWEVPMVSAVTRCRFPGRGNGLAVRRLSMLIV